MRLGLSELRTLIARLDGESADALEGQTIEFKPWDADPRKLKDQLRVIRESVVCLANADGGEIVIGVADRMRSRKEAIHGVGRLDPLAVQKSIWDGTDPRITA